MTSIDTGIAAVRNALGRVGDEWRRFSDLSAMRATRKGCRPSATTAGGA